MARKKQFYKRATQYVKDSTKGDALVHEPRTYKGDVLMQVWMDSRIVATLSNWLDQEGHYTRFMSEVVNDSMGMLVKHLVDSGSMNMVEETLEARDMLQRKYRVNLNPDGRGLKNAHHNTLLTEKIKGIGVSNDKVNTFSSNISSREEIEKQLAITEQVFKDRAKAEREPDEMKIVPQINTGGLDEEAYNRLMAEPVVRSKSRNSDAPRVKTEEELEQMETEFEKEERMELERLKRM